MLVGNDVVDLRDPDSDPETHSPRFDSRAFAPSERQELGRARDAGELRWRFWAAKEAAYKVAKKLDPNAIFSPPRFEVDLAQDLASGSVSYRPATASDPALEFDVEIEIAHEAVHAVAWLAGSERRNVVRGFERLPVGAESSAKALSGAARGLAIGAMALRLGVSPRQLDVRRAGRVPTLWQAGQPSQLDLSLSHHGRVVAFAATGSGA